MEKDAPGAVAKDTMDILADEYPSGHCKQALIVIK